MNSRFDHLTKGLLSLAVIIMFTVALIAGQARANLPAEVSTTTDIGLVTQTSILLDAESLRKLRSLAYAVDTILALPIVIELGIHEHSTKTGTADDVGSNDASVQ